MTTSQKERQLPLMTIQQVQELTTLSKPTIYRILSENSGYFDPSFPRPIKLAGRKVAWVRNEVIAWVKRRMEFNRCKFHMNESDD